MQSLRAPLERLVDELRWFADAKELRALHVHTSPAMRLSVLQHIAAEEHFPGNRSAYLLLEAPAEGDDLGWAVRGEELAVDHAELKETLEKLDPPVLLGELRVAATGASSSQGALLSFASTLLSALGSLVDPLDGLVVALCPAWVNRDKEWKRDVAELLRQPTLAAVRWILVDVDEPLLQPLVRSFGEAGHEVDARVDPEEAAQDLASMIDQMKSAPAGASPAQLAGGAGPRVAPPPRWDAVDDGGAEASAARLNELGVPAALADTEGMRAMQVDVLSAAQSAQAGDFAGAIRHQGAACAKAEALKLGRERLVLELVRGGYLLQGGAVDAAARELEGLRDRCVAQSEHDLAVQAQMALAASLLLRRKRTDAAAAYAEAGRLGHATGSTILAIEGYRMAGQLLIDDGNVEQGAKAYGRALEAADAGEPLDRALSSAPDVARALAGVYRKHNLRVQAESLDAQAARLEAEAEALASAPAASAPAASADTPMSEEL